MEFVQVVPVLMRIVTGARGTVQCAASQRDAFVKIRERSMPFQGVDYLLGLDRTTFKNFGQEHILAAQANIHFCVCTSSTTA